MRFVPPPFCPSQTPSFDVGNQCQVPDSQPRRETLRGQLETDASARAVRLQSGQIRHELRHSRQGTPSPVGFVLHFEDSRQSRSSALLIQTDKCPTLSKQAKKILLAAKPAPFLESIIRGRWISMRTSRSRHLSVQTTISTRWERSRT